jgi:thiol:disulfide interchange protein DsbD
MGAVSGIVIGPCITGPIVGILIKIAETGSVLVGFFTMFALAWGMGLLIIAAGISTGLVPKAGVWMEWFKKFFGFILLWGALYFLSPLIGDAAYQLGTALLLVTASVFLGGLDSLPGDAGFGQRLKKLFGVLCLLAALFLGLHTFNASMDTAERAATGPAASEEGFIPGGSGELEAALAEGRPAVLYFTADWCALCKTLKEKVLSRPEVIRALDGFAALRIDFDESTDLRERFGVLGPPTIVFLDREGEERKDLRFSGADKTPEEFIRMLESL